MTKPLQGIGVLVTRPEQQAIALTQKIEALGGQALLFPVIQLVEIDDDSELQKVLTTIESVDMAIFVSVNSVGPVFKRLSQGLPSDCTIVAVGQSTAGALTRQGVHVDVVPQGQFSSEGLLQQAELQQVKGKRIVIFRAEKGRELLGNTLQKRGAMVELIPVYRRVIGAPDQQQLKRWCEQKEVQVAMATSQASLDNLIELCDRESLSALQQTPLVVVSERVSQYAVGKGFKQTIVIDKVGDDNIVDAIIQICGNP